MDPCVKRIEKNQRRNAPCDGIAFFRSALKFDPRNLFRKEDSFRYIRSVFTSCKPVLAGELFDVLFFFHLELGVNVDQVEHELSVDRIKLFAETLDEFFPD